MADDKFKKPGYGALFQNREKKSEYAPDYTGSFVTERAYDVGEEIKFGMWEKQTKGGNPWFSLKEDNYKFKGKKGDTEVEPQYARRRRNDEDIPF